MLSQLLNAIVHDTITSVQSSLVSAVSVTRLHALCTSQVACVMTAVHVQHSKRNKSRDSARAIGRRVCDCIKTNAAVQIFVCHNWSHVE